ncbi:CAP domain-containing protein [Bacillus sp. OTU530]|uniref:CAP domain-containing protein n=1 Tax=Bacillus sp. OTU530 TaxID=3043862 RepID=UPI00406C02BD
MGWFCSPGHFTNMTNRQYDRIGVGFAPSSAAVDNESKWVMWLASSTNNNQFNCFSA